MLLTVGDLRKRLGIGRDRAYALMRCKTFPTIQIGKRYYVTEEALLHWLRNMSYKKIQI